MLASLAILFFVCMSSIESGNDAASLAYPPVFVRDPPTFDNGIDIFTKNDFLIYTLNSIVVSFSVAGLALLLGVPAAYGIAMAKTSKAAPMILITRVTPPDFHT